MRIISWLVIRRLYGVYRFLLNPAASCDSNLELFTFLGILMGVAIRTRKPLDLHLAPLVWKQLVAVPLVPEDIEEVCLLASAKQCSFCNCLKLSFNGILDNE